VTAPYPEHKWVALPTPPRKLGAPFRGVVPVKYRCEGCGRIATAQQIHDKISLRCSLSFTQPRLA
jgi:hypothetical protein